MAYITTEYEVEYAERRLDDWEMAAFMSDFEAWARRKIAEKKAARMAALDRDILGDAKEA
jgi:hypothetical protein